MGDVTMRSSLVGCARFAAGKGECIMATYRSGIGQNADALPLRRRLRPCNSQVIRTGLFMPNSVVAPTLYHPAANAPRPLARCPKAAKFPIHKAPGLFHKMSGLSIRCEVP
jgi:hypothetical protein